jgi:uncharacterized lipoprotein YehR (DUF1307 family)
LNKNFPEHFSLKSSKQISINKISYEKLGASIKKEKWTVDEAKEYFHSLFANNKVHVTIAEMNDAIAQCYAEAGMKGLE